MTDGFNWTCPYCNQPTTVTGPNFDTYWHTADIDETRIKGDIGVGYRGVLIACPNIECKRISFNLQLKKIDFDSYHNRSESDKAIEQWALLPESQAKPQPAYIPKQIIQDYTEACRIRSLSPKASATLSRRCLQGMIRDFWGVKVESGKLFDEINELKDKISSSEWDAIDAVRSVGNIGAHMEQDVNLIIDVEPEEADLLISLIEDLFKDWYITKHDREERQSKIIELAKSKKEVKKKNAK